MIRSFVAGAGVVGILVAGAPMAFADAQSTTVHGVLFDDQNANGVRDPGEPGLAGLTVQGGTTVTTNADGEYRLTDEPVDKAITVQVPVAAKQGALTLGKPASDTMDDWVSGWIDIPVGANPDVTYDIAYGDWHADQAVRLKADRDPKSLHPGDTVKLTADLITGKAPGYGGVLITLPKGMHFVHEYLNPGTAYDWPDKQSVLMSGLRNQLPNVTASRAIHAVVDKPLTGKITAAVTHDQGTDSTKANNVASIDVAAKRGAAAVHHVAEPATPQADAAPLADTGVETRPYLVAGLVLFGIGVALVGAARSKPRLTDVSSS